MPMMGSNMLAGKTSYYYLWLNCSQICYVIVQSSILKWEFGSRNSILNLEFRCGMMYVKNGDLSRIFALSTFSLLTDRRSLLLMHSFAAEMRTIGSLASSSCFIMTIESIGTNVELCFFSGQQVAVYAGHTGDVMSLR